LKDRKSAVSEDPGPPCRMISNGFSTLRPRIITHWSTPPMRQKPASATDPATAFPLSSLNGCARPDQLNIACPRDLQIASLPEEPLTSQTPQCAARVLLFAAAPLVGSRAGSVWQGSTQCGPWRNTLQAVAPPVHREGMVPFDANLREALERVYAAFAPYPAPARLEGAPHKDPAGMLRSLEAAPLRTLSDDQIAPYAGSALLTVGGVADYKHYLPRIIELGVRGSGQVGADAPIIAERLKRAAWRTWPEAEQVSVKSTFRAAWSWSVDQHPGFGASAEDWLCGIAALGEPIDPLLQEWSARASTEALLQSAWLAS
jgi:hypothetical protein